MGLLKECLIVFFFYKIYRQYAGGIHIGNFISCFIFSFITVFITILFSKHILITIPLELFIYFLIFYLWFKYVPQGTSQRPFRNETLKRKMKYKLLISIILTFGLRFIDLDIYKLGLFSLVFSLILTTPIIYKIFNIKHDRT